MTRPLITLGSFAFEGLEAPERIRLRSKQRISVHRLGSGGLILDSLGDDIQTLSFRGVFTGSQAARRLESIDIMRTEGRPVQLTWDTNSVTVLIREFQAVYSSTYWISYELTCFIVAGTSASESSSILFFIDSAPADISVAIGAGGLAMTQTQSASIATLACGGFDAPRPADIAAANGLLVSVDDRLDTLSGPRGQGRSQRPPDPRSISDDTARLGATASLILARARLASVLINARAANA